MCPCQLSNCQHTQLSAEVATAQACQLFKKISQHNSYALVMAREGGREGERMDKKTNLNANSLPRKDAWPPAHHSTDFSDWEIVKRKKRLSSTFLRILMFMMRRMRLMVMMMKMITTTTIMMTLTMIVRRMK